MAQSASSSWGCCPPPPRLLPHLLRQQPHRGAALASARARGSRPHSALKAIRRGEDRRESRDPRSFPKGNRATGPFSPMKDLSPAFLGSGARHRQAAKAPGRCKDTGNFRSKRSTNKESAQYGSLWENLGRADKFKVRKAAKNASDGRLLTALEDNDKAGSFWDKLLPSQFLHLDKLLARDFLDGAHEGILGGLSLAAFAGATGVLIASAFVNPTCVVSSSMAPTLEKGDCVLVDILTYRALGEPKRGDIVVFLPPDGIPQELADQGREYVKRVVATAGDSVEVAHGAVLVNGVERAEEGERMGPRVGLLSAQGQGPPLSSYLQAKYVQPEVIVPNGALFVLGDNRNRSADSHLWGFLPIEKVVGRCWLRSWPWHRIGLL